MAKKPLAQATPHPKTAKPSLLISRKQPVRLKDAKSTTMLQRTILSSRRISQTIWRQPESTRKGPKATIPLVSPSISQATKTTKSWKEIFSIVKVHANRVQRAAEAHFRLSIMINYCKNSNLHPHSPPHLAPLVIKNINKVANS